MAYTHRIAGETVTLLPEAALYWERTATLFVADVHLGKTDAFRRAGIPLPSGTTHTDLSRLMQMIEAHTVRRVIVLGDLLHAYGALSAGVLASFAAWRARHELLELMLVRGNHDRATGDPPREWGFTVVDPGYVIEPFVLHHEPPTGVSGYFALCGHLHPGALLHGQGKQRMVRPCFWMRPGCAVLPAFGSFTGCAPVEPSAGDGVYVIADGAIVAFDV
jgi:DNA ligase-associated metallophosphoesterase